MPADHMQADHHHKAGSHKAQTDRDRPLPGTGDPLQLKSGITGPGQPQGKKESRKKTAWMLLWWRLISCLCPSAKFLISCQIM